MRYRTLTYAAACVVAAAVVVTRIVGPGVDSMAIAFETGRGPEADLFLIPWWRLQEVADMVAFLAFWAIVLCGFPLALVAVIANDSPALLPGLVQNRSAVRVCMAVQSVNLGLAAVVLVLGPLNDIEVALFMMLVGVVYFVVNFLAVRVWRDRLLAIDGSHGAATAS